MRHQLGGGGGIKREWRGARGGGGWRRWRDPAQERETRQSPHQRDPGNARWRYCCRVGKVEIRSRASGGGGLTRKSPAPCSGVTCMCLHVRTVGTPLNKPDI